MLALFEPFRKTAQKMRRAMAFGAGTREAMVKISSIHRMLRLLKKDDSMKAPPFKYRELQGRITG